MRWDNNYKNPEPINDPVIIPAYGVTDEERAYWNQKQDPLEYDAVPTPYSDKHLISGAIYNALEQYKVQTIESCQAFYWGIAEGLAETKEACEASAAAAHESEVAAALSESGALNSKNAAALSESNAASSASAASISQAAAAASALAAASSESNAATSAANALTSETNAALSETNAATSETNAASSESNAATSETNAATSESNAATSETNAATSEANAATSETNASASALNAATSETNAAASETSAHSSAIDSEAWARGTRNGVPVGSTDPTYHNNSKYYADMGQDVINDSTTGLYTTWSSEKITSELSGKADLVNGKVPAAQLPSFVDDVKEYPSLSDFPATGESDKIYVADDTNLQYRWSGTTYVVISESLALGETSSTAYAGNKGKQNADNISAIQALIPSEASASNKLATSANIPTELSNLTDDSTHRLVSDSEKGDWNSKAAGNHTHDDRYYTETEVDTLLNGKAAAVHTHDDRYYTETEIDTKFNGVTFTTVNNVAYISW